MVRSSGRGLASKYFSCYLLHSFCLVFTYPWTSLEIKYYIYIFLFFFASNGLSLASFFLSFWGKTVLFSQPFNLTLGLVVTPLLQLSYSPDLAKLQQIRDRIDTGLLEVWCWASLAWNWSRKSDISSLKTGEWSAMQSLLMHHICQYVHPIKPC